RPWPCRFVGGSLGPSVEDGSSPGGRGEAAVDSSLAQRDSPRRSAWIALALVVAAVAATWLQLGWMERMKADMASVKGASRDAVGAGRLWTAVRRSFDVGAGIAVATLVACGA